MPDYGKTGSVTAGSNVTGDRQAGFTGRQSPGWANTGSNTMGSAGSRGAGPSGVWAKMARMDPRMQGFYGFGNRKRN